MSVTIPTYDWNLLVDAATNDIVYDNISNNTATYQSGLTGSATLGTVNNSNAGRLRIPSSSVSFHFNFSFEVLVRFNSILNQHQVFFSHSNDGKYGFGLYYGTYTSNELRFFGSLATYSGLFESDTTGTYTGSALSTDGSTYYHIVCVLDGANDSAYMYQDGTKIWEQTSIGLSESDFPITPSTYVCLGKEQQATNINVKTFRIWETHALSAAEIATLYNNRNTNYFTFRTLRTQNPPIYDWDFRQASSTTITDSIGGLTATYNNLTSDDTNGARCLSASSSYIELGTLNIPATLSIEIYFQTQTQSSYGQIYFGYAPTTFSYGDSSVYPASTAGTTVDETLEFYSSSTNNRLHWRNYVNGVNKSGYKVDNQGTGLIHMVATYENGSHKVYLNSNLANQLSIDTHIAQDYRFLLNKSLDSDSFTDRDIYYFRVYDYILSADQISALSANVSSISPFTFASLRINYGDVYLSQTLNKTLNDYRTENIPLNDVSFATFPINKFKETYILGDVDISGDTILRSNNTYFTDISADTFDISGNLLMSDLSANSRLFVGDDVSFNSNVTIQGDLSFGGDISFNGTFTRAQAGIGTGSGLLMNTDFSMNATLEFNGATTIKNDLHFNAYSDVSANPVLTDGTLLHNQKMEKLDHRYLLDISRSSPFSTLNYNTLPSNIYDNSTNSGICISGDGKYIRTVNSSDVSANALSYYSEDYGSSFQVDNDLSTKLSQFDVSMNSLDDYHPDITPGATYTNEPEGTTGLWSTSGTTSASVTHSSGTYSISSNSTLDGQSGTMYNVANLFAYSTSSTTAAGHAMNRTGWTSSAGANLWRHSSTSLTAYDANNSATTYNGDYITVTTPYFFQMTQIGFANHWAGNLVNKFMVIGEDSTGTKRVLLSETSHNQAIGTYTTFSVSTTYQVNKFYLHITEINSSNKFTGIRKLRWNGLTPDTQTQEFRPIFGSDKIFMSYNGQHQLVPKGISNKLTFDDFLYVSNNFGKNWTLRKNNTISTTTYAYTVTANGSSNYILNGGGFSSEAQPAVSIYLNESTEFTIDSTTNGNHPFKIGTSENGGEITDSRITSVTSGSNQVVTFKPTTSGTFYYYCSSHSGMGSSINVIEPSGRFSLDASGSTWFWNTGAVSADGKHMYVSGKTGLWKSQDFGTSWYQASADSSFNYMSISADGKQVYGVNERKVYGSSDYGNTFSTLYTDSYTSDSSYCGISTSGNGKYITLADKIGSNIYMSSDYGNSFDLTPTRHADYTSLGFPATPTYDWDFRQVASNGLNNNITLETLTYGGGVTSTTSGASFGTSSGKYMYIENLPINPASFSIEIYYYLHGLAGTSTILDMWSPTSAAIDSNESKIDGIHLGQNYWFENNQWNSIWRDTGTINGSIPSQVSGWRPLGYYNVTAATANTWYHRVLTFDGSYWRQYQDGSYLDAESFAMTAQNYNLAIMGKLGNTSNIGSPYTWKFLRIYNKALSATEITELYNLRETSTVGQGRVSTNCGISHSGKIVLNSNYISYDYGNNFNYIPYLISNQLTNNDTFYSKTNMEYLLDQSNNLMLSIPYKSAQFQDIYSVGSIKVGSTTYSSDYRIKENVEELGEEDTVNELRPVKYYNTNLECNDYGLIAHELQEKYPFLVSGEKDGPEPQSINYNGLISLIVHEVKNLKKESLDLKKEYLELQEMKK